MSDALRATITASFVRQPSPAPFHGTARCTNFPALFKFLKHGAAGRTALLTPRSTLQVMGLVCQKYPPLKKSAFDVKIITDRHRPHGACFINLDTSNATVAHGVIEALDGEWFGGLRLDVTFAHERPPGATSSSSKSSEGVPNAASATTAWGSDSASASGSGSGSGSGSAPASIPHPTRLASASKRDALRQVENQVRTAGDRPMAR